MARETAWELPDRGRVGVLCLITTEAALFTIFVVAYVFYQGKSLVGPYPKDVLELPIWSTICLLSSSITATMAERALKQSRIPTFRLSLGLTILLAAEFLRQTSLDWYRLIIEHHFTISTNLFGTTFYSLVGLHASHVIAGLSLLLIVFIAGLRGNTMLKHARRFELLSWYWHFVDTVWVVVFVVVYVNSR
jgi:cytochrome c oxidase subunit 3/cytochrome o ubiquinol oxidase subunit 3